MSKILNGRNVEVAASFTVGAEVANAIAVTVQLSDRKNGGDMSERINVAWYLSADANGDTIAAAPSSGIAIGTDGLLIEWTANVAGMVTSEADGDIDVVLTEAGTGTWYLALVMPDGKLYVSGAITFA